MRNPSSSSERSLGESSSIRHFTVASEAFPGYKNTVIRPIQLVACVCCCAALFGCQSTPTQQREPPPQPFVETLPGSTVTFTMRPVHADGGVVWFAETETTWNAYDVFYLRLDEFAAGADIRSEEHTSELQSQSNLVCRLLLEKKKTRSDI